MSADVPAAFDAAAAGYDRLTGLNPGYHRHLRQAARGLTGAGPRILDVGCGTGASTAAVLAAVPHARVVAVDGSAGMLAVARDKAWPRPVEFVHSRVEDLAAAGVAGPFDAVFAAYLVRNLPDPDTTLTALRGLLRPGGVLVIHDYSLAEHPVPACLWSAVCWAVIIPSGRLVSGDASLYRYLWRSVRRFDAPGELMTRLRRAGFAEVRCGTVRGWQRGIVHTFRATT
ncbi:class I SAM-dependent methyltransferase [Prauserella cavernicola]|uniref:Class I SAM-dependent methyltransferase n=1 Tax=Prauserella cavernicola TaxID=2800127 RepID=A0A934QMG1_9PSEU|nr:class I SAM-dependent methyltransferase [Prauserella cavernicola]MBK1782975.1 class I SAM-dependent methyltransferase [Prauserella cavernicola]